MVEIRKRISRAKMLEYFGGLPRCLVGIEACPSAHHWGRELQALGHQVRLVPPSYSIVGLLFAAVMLAIIPVSPQVTPRGVELSVDQA